MKADETQIIRPEDVFDVEWLEVVSYDETSDQFEERIIALVEDRMKANKTQRITR